MATDPIVVIRFKGVENDDELHSHLEKRCHQLSAEFPESTRIELSLSPATNETTAQVHATGKDTDVAAHATGGDLRQAAERALDKVERELRREHDKRIFARRREAQRAIGKRTG